MISIKVLLGSDGSKCRLFKSRRCLSRWWQERTRDCWARTGTSLRPPGSPPPHLTPPSVPPAEEGSSYPPFCQPLNSKRYKIIISSVNMLAVRLQIEYKSNAHSDIRLNRRGQAVTKRCRLSWLTNRPSYMSPNAGGGENCGVSANEFSSTQEPK
jgi:hypothetical protein